MYILILYTQLTLYTDLYFTVYIVCGYTHINMQHLTFQPKGIKLRTTVTLKLK
jgi:hypothetical protein